MNILVTGAKGMVGTALVNNLKNIRDGKNKTRPELHINEIYEYDLNSTPDELDEYCRKADFVFNLAGVNRPENPEDFMKYKERKTGRDKLCVELLVLQETDRQHRSCWMVCRNWNIEDMIQRDWLFVMARLWHRLSRQKAVCPT